MPPEVRMLTAVSPQERITRSPRPRLGHWFMAVLVGAAVITGCERRVRPDGSGTIEATQVDVAPEVAGRLVEVPVSEGSPVQAGDVVARIDASDYELQRDRARGEREQARAQVDLVAAGARSEDVEATRAHVRSAQAAFDLAEANRTRIEALVSSGAATARQGDEARTASEQAAASLDAAQETLAKMLRGSREEEVRAAQARLDQATAALELADRAVADCAVTAPIEGVVTTRIRDVGEFVTVGAPIVTISRLDQVWLSIYVPEARLSEVKFGASAYVKVDGDPATYEGTVDFISPEAEFTPRDVQTADERAKLVYRVKIALPNPDGVFKPGMPADGYLGARP
jgi:HlyD family secretion protein